MINLLHLNYILFFYYFKSTLALCHTIICLEHLCKVSCPDQLTNIKVINLRFHFYHFKLWWLLLICHKFRSQQIIIHFNLFTINFDFDKRTKQLWLSSVRNIIDIIIVNTVILHSCNDLLSIILRWFIIQVISLKRIIANSLYHILF